MKSKAFFIVFEGLSFGEKNKNLMKIVDTSFKSDMLKLLFVLQVFKFLSQHFLSCGKTDWQS